MVDGEHIISADGSDVADELQAGTVLFHGQYTIGKYISSGGFGITYLAKDNLNRDIVIKECFASGHCRRARSRVRLRSTGNQIMLDQLIQDFLTEARRLASLSHPNIVGVHQVFEDNDTAYMALEYIRGIDLLGLIEGQNPRLTAEHIVEITTKLVSALSYVHDNNILHCDISPDNIFLDEGGEPVLIDFGAARIDQAVAGKKSSGMAVVKDGYSPHELYFSGGNVGPWTDIYSLAASLYHLITGQAPESSRSRVAVLVETKADLVLPLAGRFKEYPAPFLESIDKAMAVKPAARFQSAAEWLAALTPSVQIEGAMVKLFRRGATVPKQDRSHPKPAPEKPSAGELPPTTTLQSKGTNMAIKLTGLTEIGGFIGGCLVDSETGLMMASEGGGSLDLEAASAANTEVVRAKLKAIKLLGLNDHIDDILISLGKQLHLIRPLEKTPTVFLYVALDRKAANLGMARVQVKNVEQSVAL